MDDINEEFEAEIHKKMNDDGDRYKFIGDLANRLKEEKHGDIRKEVIASALIREAQRFMIE